MHGKVDRGALPAPEVSHGASASDYRAPSTPVEEILAGIWEEVLGVERPGLDDSFFDLGGHSLLATQVMSRIRQAFSLDLPLRVLFESPVLEDLAREVSAARERASGFAPVPLVAGPREGALPLSFAQERLWFLDRLEPGRAAYNMSTAVRLRNHLDVASLRAAITEVARRHESLRTRFASVEGTPEQVIDAPAPVLLPMVDLEALPDAARGAEVRRLGGEQSRRPFDLSTGPLLRILLLRLGEAEHGVLLTMHHIVSDGWSMGVLVQEIGALYGAFTAREPSPLPDLGVHYVDYALWQRERLQGEALERELGYWREQLGGAPVLELPTDRPVGAALSTRGAGVSRLLRAPLGSDLAALGRRTGATSFMTLLAGFQVLLSRLSGQRDVSVGSPVAGREASELEGLIGFFVNTLVLRGRLEVSSGFRAHLDRIREVCLGAYTHQEVPFERLVAELQPQRSLSHTPLFQVMLVVNAAAPEVEAELLQGLESSALSTEVRDEQMGLLTLTLSPEGEGLRAGLGFNRDLFDRTTAQRWLAALEVLLHEVCADPERPLDELSLLSKAERHQLCFEWTDTTTAGSPKRVAPPGVLPRLFERARRTPDAEAVVAGERRLRYAELERWTRAVAAYLRGHGVARGEVVGLCLERSVEAVVGLLGILRSGAAYLPLDPKAPAERLVFSLQDAGVRTLLTQAHRVSDLTETLQGTGVEIVALDAPDAFPGDPVFEEITISADDLAYVIYTSGSTGRPKGVLVQHGSLDNIVDSFLTSYAVDASDRVLQQAALTFDVSVNEILPILAVGGTLVLVPEEVRLDFPRLLELVVAEGVSILGAAPSLLARLNEAGSNDAGSELGRLRLILSGGEALSVSDVDGLLASASVINGYGPTEATVAALSYDLRRLAADGGETIPIGRPLQNYEVYVLDREGHIQGLGQPGELVIGGSGLARGYLGRPGRTAAAFVPHPFASGERLYRTGDLARWRSDGQVEFLGRIDHQVKIRGFRIELGEIETRLLEHAGVTEAVVLAREDVPGDRRLVAYWVGSEVTPASLRSHLSDRLPEHMVPAAFVRLDALPLTVHGKVDREVLPAPELSHGASDVFRAPTGPVEEILAGIWEEVLSVDRIGADDDFFALGGHSLLVTQVMSRVREQLGIELPLRRLFEAPTVASLARGLAEDLRSDASPAPAMVRVDRARPLLPSFAQQRLWFLHQAAPESPAYNISEILVLEGAIDPRALARAFSELVRRHEVLRTIFEDLDGVPIQVMAPPEPVAMPRLDLRSLPAARARQEAQRLAAEEGRRPFDLARGPVLRLLYLQVADEVQAVVATLHHIASDGWSSGILRREMQTLYLAFAAGRPSPLPELPLQYADYAAWQRQWLSGETLEGELAYWRHALEGMPTLLDLPTDRPRPPVQGFRGSSRRIRVPAATSAALRPFARRLGATPFMAWLGIFQAFLARMCRQSDLCVGTPVAGRHRLETEGLIGFFINTLVLRARLGEDDGLESMVSRARETSLAAHGHQDLPFERLVEELAPGRSRSHQPVVQVLLKVQTQGRDEGEPAAKDSVWALRTETEAVRFDLTLSLDETSSGFEGSLQYRSELFDATTIDRWSGHLLRFAAAGLESPERSFLDLPLLSPAQTSQLLWQWNDSERPRLDETDALHLRFAERAARRPDAMVLVHEDQWLSHGEVQRRAERVAAWLRSFGVSTDQPVALCLERSVEMVIAMLGTWKAGGAYLPLDPDQPRERLASILDRAGDPLVLSTPALASRLPAGARFFDLPKALEAQPPATEPPKTETPAANPSSRQLAYVLFTSGSTGLPKGVAVEHRQALGYLDGIREALSLRPGAHLAMVSTFAADLGHTMLLPALCGGGCLHVLSPERATDPEGLATYFRQRRIDGLKIVPSHLSALLEGPDPQGVIPREVLVLGGEASSWQLVETVRTLAPDCRVFNHYGPTESTVGVLATRLSSRPIGSRSARPVPLGRPLPGSRVVCADSSGRPVPMGVAGELSISGGGVARGYLGDPAQTAERFRPDPESGRPGARRYVSGDLGRHRADGALEFLGRIDAQVKVRGFRVEPGEIEAALEASPAVREAVVVLRTDGSDAESSDADGSATGGRLVAYVVPADSDVPADSGSADGDAGLDDRALRHWLIGRVPEPMVPQIFVTLEALPLNANGKVDRLMLPEPRAEIAAFVAPRTATEARLAELFGRVLGQERVSVDADFFALGGHSLDGMRLLARVRKELGRKLPAAVLFEAPTVAGMAALLDGETDVGLLGSALVTIQPEGSRPPLYCVHPLDGEVLGYRHLARYLGPEQPLYGLQVPALESAAEGVPSIEEMAAEYLEAVRGVQPTGPYFLAGWSFGCTVAYEMAQSLRREGEEVGLLVLLDGVPPSSDGRRVSSPDDDALLLAQLVEMDARLLGIELEVPADALRRLRAMPRGEGLQRVFELGREAGVLEPDSRLEDLLRRVAGYRARVASAEAYRPEPYAGRILFVGTPADGPFPGDETKGWGRLATSGLETRSLDCAHELMFQEPHIRRIAQWIETAIGDELGAFLAATTGGSEQR